MVHPDDQGRSPLQDFKDLYSGEEYDTIDENGKKGKMICYLFKPPEFTYDKP